MTNIAQQSDYLTVEEAAQMLRLHPRTILNRIREGTLPAKRVKGGKSKLIARADVFGQLEDVRPARRADSHNADLPPVIPPSPLIDRLGTAEGRARAVAALRALREADDEGEQQAAWEVLKNGVTPLSLRRCPPGGATSPEEAA